MTGKEYVLKKFTSEELRQIDLHLAEMVTAITTWISKD
jgi:peptidyl-tRNA hydrolase